MNKEQESSFAMNLKVRNFNEKNATALAVVPAVVPYFATVKTKITDLILADAGGRSDVSGFAIAKVRMRETLEGLALKISNALASYALVNSDYVLQKKADFPTSAWYKFSEEELVTQATIVKNLSVPLSANLAVFGATAADITAIGTTLNSFTDIISNPSLAIDQRKNDNQRVVVILDEIRTILTEKLDVLMRSFEVNNPSLYSLYLSARAIDTNGSVMKPTVISELLPATLKTVHTAANYSPDTFYTVQNLGTETVFFSLSALENTAGTEEVLLNAGETRARLAENLAPFGTFLIVRNPGATPANVKIWVE
ncbi:hypothetical protein [uncultured Flavobacterium sp.]|uniref:hypothetical protein n=1 Tax=uncultured Flavobacterium sp. TaxID=165435 RepID=UPI0025D5F916|nr:hypothetical protein [uncultured Flavobacterium sp.]